VRLDIRVATGDRSGMLPAAIESSEVLRVAVVAPLAVPGSLLWTDLGPGWAAALLLAAVLAVPAALAAAVLAIGERTYRGAPVVGWLRLVAMPYLRYFQRLRVEGRHLVPRSIGPDGLILVSTHGAGLDPVSLTVEIPHPIRWMMSAEMMLPSLGWLWKRMRIIPVAFDARDASALKAAIAHVQSGGVLGIFPEGGIERPPRMLRPFSGGLRLILARTKAPVLVAVIDPGAVAESAYGALFKPTRPTIRFLALVEPGPNGHGRDAAETIFALLRTETGWPVNNDPMPPANPETVARNLAAFQALDPNGSHG
jgi:1-acyl-sn-glycerol-3-phosphate acyltransferase